jgi:uncharacterized membrane protein YccC
MFGAFVGLVFCDYGGPPLRRAGAYLVMIVLGVSVITLGAALSTVPVLGVVGMFVLMFCATLASAFGGYFPLHVAPVALAYSLSVLEPLRDLALPDRWLGWLIGGTMALVAALALWPFERRTGLRGAAIALARDLGEVIATIGAPASAERLDRIADSVTDLEARLESPLRPFGPGARDIHMVHMVQHLESAVEVAAGSIARGVPRGDDAALVDEVALALTRAADVLAGERPPEIALAGLAAIDVATVEELRSLEARVDVARHDSGDPLDQLHSSIPLLTLAHLAVWIEYDAVRVVDGRPDPTPDLATAPEVAADASPESARRIAGRTGRLALTELDPEGVILGNSIRAGAALAAAVAITEVLDLEFGFWVALAALCVLRSGVSSTLACARQAVFGTIVGFVVAALLVLVIGDSDVALWIIFPLAVFLAGYAPGAIHFAVGQAAFTVTVVVLFGILDLPGFRTDVLRVENVTVGAVVAVGLSLVVWPRGARQAIARTVASMYRSAADATETFITGTAAARAEAAERLSASRRRAEDAFAAAIAEHTEPIDVAAWVTVFQVTRLSRALTLGLLPTVDATDDADRDLIAAMRETTLGIADDLRAIAGRLDDAAAMPPAPDHPPIPVAELERYVTVAVDDHRTSRAIVLVWWDEMLRDLAADIASSRSALDEIAASSAPRVWLHGVDR